MFIHTFFTPGLAINTYLIADTSTRKAVIIDPTREITLYLEYAEKENIHIQDILETHVHADFVSGARELKQAYGGSPKIHCSAMGGSQWIPAYADQYVKGGDSIDFPGLRLTALHTPGHTYEHITWLCYDKGRSLDSPSYAFTGDFLFVGSVGRPDLLGQSDAEKLSRSLYDSLFIQLEGLPDFMEIYPGHGAGSLCGKALSARPVSTLGYERKANPNLQKKPYEEWVSGLYEGMSPAPLNFRRIKQINLKGFSWSEAGQNIPKVYIDIRAPAKFAECHIKDALNVPLGSSFCNWVGSVLYENMCLGVLADSADNLSQAVNNLKLIGFDPVSSKLLWDQDSLKKNFILVSEEVIDAEKLYEKIQAQSSDLCIIDVRTTSEWDSGHIKQAHHIDLSELVNQLDKLPTTCSIYTLCGSGYRSSLAASFLKQKGYSSVFSVTGGMNAWIRAGLPIFRI